MKVRKILSVAVMAVAVLVLAMGCAGKTSQPSSPPAGESGIGPGLTNEPYSVPHDRPGPAADVVEFASFGIDQALADLKAGKMDIYLFGLKIAAAKQLLGDQTVKSYQAPASSISLLLNPAPAREGELNPFSIKEVRQAMQYLINRSFIAQDLYGGLAIPQYSHVSPLEYDYLTVAPAIAAEGIHYDPDYARQQIAEAMTRAGAEFKDGKWHYNGRPIRLNFIIRIEDERRDVGDTIRTALEQVGFEAVPMYKNFAAAIFSVYTSDPQAFGWHLYTEGWGKGSAQKFDFGTINQMSAPWMGNMPGWLIVGYWQYLNEQLDELGKKLFTGDFQSRAERDQIYRQMTELALDESVRIWIATVYNTFPADKELTGVAQDLSSGPKSMFTCREAYVQGKGNLRFGNLWVWTERSAWNPIGGFSDVYSTDIWKCLTDPALVNHPFRGTPISYRADFEVATAGPSGSLQVPSKAVMWDADNNVWQPVGPGVAATSKVIFDYSKYFQSTWHHGQPITMADVVYQLASLFERTYDEDKSRIEFVQAATLRPLLDQFRGFEVLDENRIAVYLDFWHFEEEYIASYASLTSLPVPWELQAAMDELVFGKRQAAYSQSSAARFNVPWLSLVMRRDASFVATILRDFQRQGFVPVAELTVNNQVLVDSSEASARYASAIQWFEDYGHLVISQGPYRLVRFDAQANYARLEAFREPNYPFKPGDWYFGAPQSLLINDVDTRNIEANQSGEILVKVEGPGNPVVNYVILDSSTSTVVAEGQAAEGMPGVYAVLLDAQFTRQHKGKRLQLQVYAASDEVIMVKTEQFSFRIN